MKLSSTTRRVMLVAATALILPVAANAADLEPVSEPSVVKPALSGFYVSAFGGASFSIGDTEFTNGITTLSTDFNTGFIAGVAAGYRWNDFSFGGLTPRTEVEVNFFRSGIDGLNFSGNGPAQEVVRSGSDISGIGAFANLYLDYVNAFDSGITPYVYGGVGAAFVDFDIAYNAGNLNLQDDDTAFAWQVGAGASVDVIDNVSLFTDVRYQQLVNINSIRRAGATPVAGAGGGSFEDTLNNVIVRAGVSVAF